MSECSKGNIIQVITNIATVLSLLLGFYQFFQYKKNLRVERAMSFNRQYLDSEILKANRKLSLGNKEKEEIVKLKQLSNGNKELKERLIRSYILRRVRLNEEQWFTMYDFYSAVFQCIDKELCDELTINHSIKSSGLKFFKNFIYYNCKYEANKSDEIDLEMLKKVRKYFYNKFSDCNFKSSYL